METFEYIPWGLLTLVLIIAFNRSNRVDDLLKEVADLDHGCMLLGLELQEKQDSYNWEISIKNSLIKELERELKIWKHRAITPLEDPKHAPVIISRGDIKHWVSRTEIYGDINGSGAFKIRPGEVERATQSFLDSIRPFIYSELVRENGRVEYFQEIYLSKPEKLYNEKQR